MLHAQGDATGAEMVRALTVAVRRAQAVEVMEECFAADLVLDRALLERAIGRRR